MKKFIKIFVFIFVFMLFSTSVKAGSFSLFANPQTVTVGNTVKVTVNISNLAGNFSITSSDNSVLSGGASDWYEGTTTLYFTAKKAGTATITVKAQDVADFDTETKVSSSKSITIKVTNPSSGSNNLNNNSKPQGNSNNSNNSNAIDINKKYSSDNTLKKLVVEGYELNFDKEKTEYNLDVDEDVTSVNVTAVANDAKANIIGTGNIKLTDGVNNIKITVVAENGNEKVYQISINVKDLEPIKVELEEQEYNVVKRVDKLTAPDNFIPIEATIDSKKVPALYNDITGYILVGLKDEQGNIKLYVYDPKTDKYSIYNEMSFNSVKLFYTKPSSIPKGFKKIKLKINDEEVTAYEVSNKSDFYLVYGMNVNTGEIGWYRYDCAEKTLQRYETKDLEALTVINNKYLITIVILSVSILMLLSFMMVLMVKIRNRNIRS